MESSDSTSRLAQPEATRYILRSLRSGAERDEVIRVVAERWRITWTEAQLLVSEVEAQHRGSIATSQRLIGIVIAVAASAGILAIVGLTIASAIVVPITDEGIRNTGNPSEGAGMLGIIIGIFTVMAGVFDWDWFLSHRKARAFIALFGRMGARAFYVILGCVIIGLGLFMLFQA